MATPTSADSSSTGNPDGAIQYAYMFEKNKSPTKQLDALLRAIARYIAQDIGDRHELHLTPKKLAAFYKTVGGDYDSLFVEMPHDSISYVWQVTGCQHTLQPTDDDFAPPSVPALTPRGFSRWESLEILLGPEEHVPFLQFAAKNWPLKHPDTGAAFPHDLPADVFPVEADADVDRWHQSCGERLRKAASRDSERNSKTDSSGVDHSEPRSAHHHQHHHGPSRQHSIDGDHVPRQASYTHVPGRHPANHAARMQTRFAEVPRRESPPDERGRRRSLSDYPSPPTNPDSPHGTYPPSSYMEHKQKRPGQFRRPSQSKQYSSDSSADEHITMNPRTKRRHHPESPPPPSIRRFAPPPGAHPASAANAPPGFRPHRAEMREQEQKKRTHLSPLGTLRNKLSETVNNILPGSSGSDRPRTSRQNSYDDIPPRPRRSRDQLRHSRLTRSYSDLDSDASSGPEASEEDLRRRRRLREQRERERLRDRDRGRARDLDRELDDDRDFVPRRDRQYPRRPGVQRRTSSHADIDRHREPWDPHDRERARSERKNWERRGERMPSPVTGVGGRRYPAETAFS